MSIRIEEADAPSVEFEYVSDASNELQDDLVLGDEAMILDYGDGVLVIYGSKPELKAMLDRASKAL